MSSRYRHHQKTVFFLIIASRSIVTSEQERRAGVGNSFGFASHIRDKLGIRGPVHVHTLRLKIRIGFYYLQSNVTLRLFLLFYGFLKLVFKIKIAS